MGDIFWVAKISFFYGGGGVFEIPDIFGGRRVDAGPEPTYEEKLRVPPPPVKLSLVLRREAYLDAQ